MLHALSTHWPEYIIEAALLGAFMVSACLGVFVLEHPSSPFRKRIPSAFVRRAAIGILMGITAVGLIYSPWGQRSGAHMNPATTLAFLSLGKIKPWDAAFYVLAQFAGGVGGVVLSGAILGPRIRHETVNFAVTLPGPRGRRTAFAAEFAISFGMMAIVLLSTNNSRTAPFTGFFAGLLLVVYIAFEAPLSGMSINPARTLGSAIPARRYQALWLYFLAPPLGMLAAAGVYSLGPGLERVYCAKLNHAGHRCIFNCGIDHMPGRNFPRSRGIEESKPISSSR